MKTINIQGSDVPCFIYGTAWKKERTKEFTLAAIESGFRAIDTANQRVHYFEAGVGDALLTAFNSGLVTREDLFLQTKYTYSRSQDHRLPYNPEANHTTQVQQSFASSLEHLNVSYLDSYVLHGPFSREGNSDIDLEVWQKMEKLYQSGKTKLLGVSNFRYGQLKHFIENVTVKPHFVQNRCYANKLWDKNIRNLCSEHGIVYQGFSLLTGNRNHLPSPIIETMVQTYDCTIPQLIFRFAMQIGMIPLTGTTNPTHMLEDLKAFDFEMSALDIERIENIARTK